MNRSPAPAGRTAAPSLPTSLGMAALAIALSIALAACSGSEASPGAGAPPPPDVSVAVVAKQAVTAWDEFNGRIAAVEQVDLRPRVSGYIQRVAFTDGQAVRKGDLLFVIDPRPYQAALDRAQAELEHARSEARLADAQSRRARTLVDASAISREELEARDAATAQAHARVRAAEAAVAAARINLQYTQVRAPIDGRASRALITAGNLAQADATLLTTIVSDGPVHVYFDADEATWLRYQAEARRSGGTGKLPVQVALSGDEGFPHVGHLDFTDNRIDPRTGTLRARAVLANPAGTLTPGLFARVRIAGGGRIEAMLVDEKAVLTDQDRKYVYVVGRDNTAVRKDIVTGARIDGMRVVQSGLAPGDRVVVNGVQKVFFPGMPVKPTAVPMAGPARQARAAR